MNELLEKINQTFDAVINTSSDETSIQLRILKGNINTLFKEAIEKNAGVSQPVEQVVTTEVQNVEPTIPQEVSTSVEQIAVETVSNKTILIVDDSSIIRNYLQKAIGDKYTTISVNGGQEAIDTIPNNNVDLILLDLMMPGIDGFGVLDFLKSNNITTPVVIISGDTTKETIDRAFTYNVVDMIEKPFSEKVIMDKINRILD